MRVFELIPSAEQQFCVVFWHRNVHSSVDLHRTPNLISNKVTIIEQTKK